ncbi:uncharacterized protein N7483_008677 [Penicillium malachiteum]|uniref:uncharacterized protein n=1 Tax=Penicillium malachiteum TaxID=1324776 RepID=UPI0025486C8C|nr:uncharacterized protein N7483_008677 [Penicillium malachiteum]KAJ5720743.1 hypothetical protein N7483_008677 [Penicillium malachiteum]
MAEAVGLTASIIGIVTLAYQSSKTLYELIDGVLNAPKYLKDLNEDVTANSHILASLKSAIEGTSDDELSDGVKNSLKDAQPAIKGCEKVCNELFQKISQITSHSSSTHTRLDDRLRLKFQDKAILAFKYRIESYKSTLSIVLGMVTLKYSDYNSESVHQLQTTITETMSNISEKIQGLEITTQALSEVTLPKRELIEVLDDQNKALAQCLQVCTGALEESTRRTGSLTARYISALDDARQLIVATIGDVGSGFGMIDADMIIAQGRADQMVAQSITQDVALGFFAPRNN